MSASQLPTPTITAEVFDRTKIRISGLSVANATGYQVKIGTLSGGLPTFTVVPVDGSVTFDRLIPRSVYYVQARVLGDDETYTNSGWCAEQTIVTGAVIDQTMEIPQISASPESFTTIKITGIVQYEEYRYQIATTSAGVESAPIKNTGNYGGYMYIRGLEPGTTYYIRFCKVDLGRCSLWSDIVSCSTEAVTNTITVTSGDDSGEGTLRKAVSDATNGTKIVLDVDTITLNSVINNTTKYLFIIGGRTERTTIQPGNNNALLSITYLSGRHLRFTGNVGSAIALTYGHYDDCVLDSVVTTGTSGFASSAGFTNSTIIGCVSGNYALRYGATYDTVIDGCYNTGTNADGGGANAAVLNNCLIRNCTAKRHGGGGYSCTSTTCTFTGNSAVENGGGANSGTMTNCTFTGNIATRGGGAAGGSAYSCIFTDNTAEQNGGGTNSTNLTNCLVTRNKCLGPTAGTANSGCGGGTNGGTITDCEITYNSATQNGGGSYGGTLTNCTITNNESGGDGGGVSGDSTKTNCLIKNNVASGYGGGAYSGTLTRCVVTDNQSGSVGGGSCSSSLNSSLLYGNRTGQNANDYSHYMNYVRYVRNATIGVIQGVYSAPKFYLYNTLYKSMSGSATGGNANNIAYGNNEDDYFVDAANGDYHLKPSAPAVGAGNNQYVTTYTDLAGNPRISGTNVDVGAYEFEPIQLSKPTLDLTAGHGQATISFTLPDYCSGYLIEYADNADFTNASSTTATTTGFVLPGLSGDVYLRSKYLGTSGLTLDSEYSDAVHHYFDVTAPAVVVSREPIEMTCGQAVDLLDGLVVTDDYDQEITPHYQVLDRDDSALVIDGADTDIPAEAIDVGNYKIVFTASDAAGNTATADRGLAVLPPFLTAPTISLSATSTVITVSGLTTAAAAGFQLRWTVHGAYNWTIGDTVQPAGGSALITELIPGTAYDVQARAIGTDGVSRTSPWSDCVRVITLPESSTPVLGLLGSILGQAARAFEIAALYKRGDQTGTVHVVLEQQEVIDLSGEVYQTRRVQPMTLSLIELREAMGNGFTPKAGDIVVAADQTFRLTDYSGVVTTTQFTVENDRVRIYGVRA